MEIIKKGIRTEYKILIDDEDYPKIENERIYIRFTEYNQPYPVIKTSKKLSRFILGIYNHDIIIHKNNNRLDCRKENLFVTSQKQLRKLVDEGKIATNYSLAGVPIYIFKF